MAQSERPNQTEPKKSKVETLKENSHNLRGRIAEELAEPTARFSGDSANLLKFHGMYQQEDRDQRRSVKESGGEKSYRFMIRSKIPGGRLTAEQYLAHDALATRYANGTLRITTRQDFQFHGILKGDLRATIRSLNEHLVTTLGACGDIARNVMTCPAPLSDRASAEVQDYAWQISEFTLPRGQAYHEVWIDGERVAAEPEAEPLYGTNYLPRKFKTGIAFPGDNCIDLYTQDLGYVPHLVDGRVAGFTLLAGGGLGMTHHKRETFPRLADPIGDLPPELLLPSVEAVIGAYRDFGDRANRRHARLKYVVEELGVPAFTAEVSRRIGRPLAPPRPLVWESAADHLGWGRQASGRWFLGVPVENGRIRDTETSATLTALRTVIEQTGCAVRLTAQQNILLCGLAESERRPVEDILRRHRVPLAGDLPKVVQHALACPAIPTCGLAIAEAERALPAVVRELAAELARLGLDDEDISVRMTGCPNGCARPYVAEIGFVGKTANVYDIFLGGTFRGLRLGQTVAENVPVRDLVTRLSPVFEAYRRERQAGEEFGEYCARIGAAALRERAALVAVS